MIMIKICQLLPCKLKIAGFVALMGLSFSCSLNPSSLSNHFQPQAVNSRSTDIYKIRDYKNISLVGKNLVVTDANHGFRILDASTYADISDVELKVPPSKMLVDGKYVFALSLDGFVHVFDISRPEKPVAVTKISLNLKLGVSSDISVSNGVLQIFVKGKNRLTRDLIMTYNVESLTNPKLVSTLDLESSFADYHRFGNWTYVTLGDRLRVFDYSNPSEPLKKLDFPFRGYTPLRVGNYLILFEREPNKQKIKMQIYTAPENKEFKLVSTYEYKGSYGSVISDGFSKLFLKYSNDDKDGLSTLEAIELSQEGAPKQIAKLDISNSIYEMKFSGDNLHVIGSEGIYTIPVDLKSDSPNYRYIQTRYGFLNVLLGDSKLYVTSRDKTMVFDWNAQNQFQRLADLPVRTLRQARYQNKHLFILNEQPGFEIYDVSQPNQAVEVSRLTLNNPTLLILNQTYAYINESDGISIVDISKPSSPKVVSKLLDISYSQAYVKNDILFLLDRHEGLSVYDVSDKKQPKKISHLKGSFFMSFAFIDNYIYLAYKEGIKILDAKNPNNIRLVKEFLESPYIGFSNVWIYRDRLYLSTWLDLFEYSISDPQNPKFIRQFPDTLEDIIMTDSHFLLVTARSEKIKLVSDLSDFSEPLSNPSPRLIEAGALNDNKTVPSLWD